MNFTVFCVLLPQIPDIQTNTVMNNNFVSINVLIYGLILIPQSENEATRTPGTETIDSSIYRREIEMAIQDDVEKHLLKTFSSCKVRI